MDYKILAEKTQIERDELVYLYLNKLNDEKKTRLCWLMYDVVDFDPVGVIKPLIPLIVKTGCVELLLRQKTHLKRKIILSEFLEICRRYDLVMVCYGEVLNLKDLKTKYNNIKEISKR